MALREQLKEFLAFRACQFFLGALLWSMEIPFPLEVIKRLGQKLLYLQSFKVFASGFLASTPNLERSLHDC